MTEHTTIRARLQAIEASSCEEYQSPDTVPSFEVIRQIYSDAVAALALLDEAERPGLQDMYLGGACACDAPDGRSDCCICDQGYALVPDPASSSVAPPHGD